MKSGLSCVTLWFKHKVLNGGDSVSVYQEAGGVGSGQNTFSL